MIKAIPVIHKGVRFRSTLEADWAEYFDELGLSWAYEPGVQRLRTGVAWLPDFYLPDRRLYVECKAWFGDRLDKVGLFVRETHQDALACFPEGRFVLCSHYDWLEAEIGVIRGGEIPRFLLDEDWGAIASAMKQRSCLSTDEAGQDARFLNNGEFCDIYCGLAPDYFGAISDRNREDGGDARSYYWAGYSTWHQRGFRPTKHERAL